MPTKPTFSKTFATTTPYTGSPAVGNATKLEYLNAEGFTPGLPIHPEAVNFELNALWNNWTTWVFLGTSAADEDAHLVETDSVGHVQAKQATFGGSGQSVSSLVVNQNTAGDGTSLFVTYTGGTNRAATILQSAANAFSALDVTNNEGTGGCLTLLTAGTNTGVPLIITTDSGNVTSTVDILTGSNDGIVIDSTPGTGDAINISGTAGNGLDITTTTGAGATIATTTGNALTVTSTGSGTGLDIDLTAGTGRGVIITTVDGEVAPLRIIGRDLPSGGAAGDVYVDDDANRERFRVHLDGAFSTAWETTWGHVRGFDQDLTESNTTAASWTSKATVTLAAGAGLISGATVYVRGTCEVGADTTGVGMQLRIRDTTAGADAVATQSIRAHIVSTAAQERYVVIDGNYTLPGSGARTLALQFQSNGVIDVFIRRASLELTGQF